MKKFLSVVLAFLMLAVMLPTTALAAEKPVKVVGGAEYESLEAAIAAAVPVNGVITYEISGRVTADSTGWVQVAKAGLTDLTKVEFVGKTNDAEICITGGEAILADQTYADHTYDIDVSFTNLKLSKQNPTYAGDYGHSTKYFTCWLRNTNAAENTVTYTNCTFPNGVCNNQYGKTIFDNCNFTNNTSGLYNLWNYGGNTEIKNSTFTGTRGIKAYNEGTLGTAPTITISNTSFTGLTQKAAAVVSKATNVIFMGVSAMDCPNGLLQKDIEGSTKEEKVTIAANGTNISGEFKITANKSPEAAKTEFSITGGTFTGNTDSVKDYLPEGKTINSNGAVVDKGATPPTDGPITIIVPSTEETPKTDDQKNPSTGANDMVAAAAALMAVAALGMSILSRKK
mgnify:CR=1 FL=1